MAGGEKEYLWMVAYKLGRELESLYETFLDHTVASTATAHLSRGVLRCSANSCWDQLWKKAILRSSPSPTQPCSINPNQSEGHRERKHYHGPQWKLPLDRDLRLSHFGSNHIKPKQQLQVLWCSYSTATLHLPKKKAIMNKPVSQGFAPTSSPHSSTLPQ